MLKDKSLLEFSLVTDINVQESEKICGGAEYTFINRLDSDMPFTILLPQGGFQKERLEPFNEPGDRVTLDLNSPQVNVLYDSIQGQGFNVEVGVADPGTNTFDFVGGNIVLFGGGVVIEPASGRIGEG